MLKHFCGPRDIPIYIRTVSYDLLFLLTTPELFSDQNEKDDELPDPYEPYNVPAIEHDEHHEPTVAVENQPSGNEDKENQKPTIDLTNSHVYESDSKYTNNEAD